MEFPSLRFDRRVGLIVFCFSLGLLLYELCLTRVLSVFFYYHTAFLAVSLAMLGVGAGGVWVYLFEERLRKGMEGWMLVGGVVVSSIAWIFALLKFDHTLLDKGWTAPMIGIFLFVALACLVPFLMGGVVWAWWFRAYRKDAAILYGWDLVGAAVGALLLVPVMEWLGGPAALMLCGIVLLWSAGCAAWLRERVGIARLSWLAGIVVLVALGVQMRYDYLAIQVDMAPEKRKQTRILFKKWNAFSRVVLLTQQDWYRGLSDQRREFWRGKVPAQREALIDINAFAPLVQFDGDLKKVRYLGELVSNLGYHLLPPQQKVAIVGPGGGKDVLGALLFSPKRVVGIEINPILVHDIVRGHSRRFVGDLYRHPKVDIRLGDGRATLQRINQRFGLIIANSVATWAAHSSGAMNLAEHSLYTVESCGLYLDRLEKNGILSVSLWDLNRHALPLRWLETCGTAARQRGIPSLFDRAIVVGNSWDKASWFTTVMISRSPWTEKQKQTLYNLTQQWGYDLMHMPGYAYGAKEFRDYFAKPVQFVSAFPFNIRAATDDKPFFLYTVAWRDAVQFWKRKLWEENAALVNLLLSLFLVSGLLVFVVGIPLVWRQLRGKKMTMLRGYDILYFLAIGLGFMLVEIPMIQRLTLFLGHPTYALTVGLAALLLYSGLGSLWVGRWSEETTTSRAPRILLLLCGLLLGLRFVLDPILSGALGWSTPGRIALALVLLAPFGICMGMPLPLGMLRLGASRPASIPWAWGINGASSVVASVAALLLAAMWGFQFVFTLAVGCYLLAWIATRRAE